MRIYSNIMISISIACLSLSCNKDDQATNPTPTGSVDMIAPLNIGNQWKYVDSIFNTSGILTSRDSSTLEITGSMDISVNGSNVKAYYWNWIDSKTGKPQDWKWLCSNEENGLCYYGGKSSKGYYIFSKSLQQKYPVSVNDSWQRISYTTSGDSTFRISDTTIIRCASVNEKFITPLGDYYTIVYSYVRGTTTTYLYYTPNIGYIGLVSMVNGKRTFKKTMSFYKIIQ